MDSATTDQSKANQLLRTLKDAADAETRGVLGPQAAKALRQVLESLKDHSRFHGVILSILAYASRQERWRAPLGEAGCIQFALEIMEHAECDSHQRQQATRLLGNVCADHDDNRARLLELKGLPRMMAGLTRHPQSTVELTILALFNVCCDNEEAQKALYEEGAFLFLREVLRCSWSPPASFLSYACQLLSMAPIFGECAFFHVRENCKNLVSESNPKQPHSYGSIKGLGIPCCAASITYFKLRP